MRIAFWLSTLGGSPLQCGLERGFRSLGHDVEDWKPLRDYGLILMFNQVAHDPSYVYPAMPMQRAPIAFIDTAEYGYFKRLPGVVGQYANAFAPCSLTHDSKSIGQQMRLREFLQGRTFPYFIREKSVHLKWPSSYHPIDYPLYHLSVCDERPNREEYLRRPMDFYLAWGGSHPWRLPITEALRSVDCRSEIHVIGEPLADTGRTVQERIPQTTYFYQMRQAKATASFDGYGSGSFRMMEALVRTTLVQGKASIEFHAPLIDGETCIEFEVQHDGEEFVSSNAAEKLREALADPERSYRIYAAGYDHAMTHYTERAWAQYVIETTRRHDWTQPTPLDLGEWN